MPIQDQRRLARALLDDSSAADAPTAYYVLFHPAPRSALFLHTDEAGRAAGVVGRFQTGMDLFRPLVTLRCRTPEIAAGLLDESLAPGRPYILFANVNQLPLVSNSLQIDNQRILQIYQLDLPRFKPVINVLAQSSITADGLPRCKIGSGIVQAVAGVNWQSPAFAEVYVQTEPAARQRGWGQSVVSAVTRAVLDGGRIPLYLVENGNDPSRQIAENLGYTDTGARQVIADVVYLGHPDRPTE